MYGASLAVQWLRLHLAMQGTLVQDDPTSRGAAKPVCHRTVEACALQPLHKRSHCSKKPTHHKKSSPRQHDSAAAKAHHSQKKNKIIFFKKLVYENSYGRNPSLRQSHPPGSFPPGGLGEEGTLHLGPLSAKQRPQHRRHSPLLDRDEVESGDDHCALHSSQVPWWAAFSAAKHLFAPSD